MTEKTISFKIDSELADSIKKRAIDRNMTIKDLMTELIQEELVEKIM